MTPERLEELKRLYDLAPWAPAAELIEAYVAERAAKEYAQKRWDSYHEERNAMRARSERAEALLRKLEWVAHDRVVDGEEYAWGECPCCCVTRYGDLKPGDVMDSRPTPHQAGCELAAIIGAKVAT